MLRLANRLETNFFIFFMLQEYTINCKRCQKILHLPIDRKQQACIIGSGRVERSGKQGEINGEV
jgi:hypothetical protein